MEDDVIFPVGFYGGKLHFNYFFDRYPLSYKATADGISRRQLREVLFPTHLSSPGIKLSCQLHEHELF